MADASTAQTVELSLVAWIVHSYVAQNTIGIDQLASLISTVHRSLSGLGKSAGKSAPAPAPLVPAVSIRRSVQRDRVVCLECGFLSQMLRRHIRVAHGLEPAGYRVRWELPADHPITAPAYSERRSTLAKRIGLGRIPQEAVASTPTPAVVAPLPKRRGRKPRSAAADPQGT
jgi:predicted transcriptional regulator